MKHETCLAQTCLSCPPSQQVPMFVVEGNMGAGKTTFLNMLTHYMDVQLIFEPHQLWQNVGGENILDHFFKDPTRWAYSFQSYVFVSRVIVQHQADMVCTQPLQVLERSVYSDRFCFAKNCYELGYMTSLEWKMYIQWFSWLVKTYTKKPAGFIYLRTSPEVCFKRLQKRNRFEETGVTFDYISLLHTKHERWLIDQEEDEWRNEQIPVLVLDNDQDFEHNGELQRMHVEKICAFAQQYLGIEPHTLLKKNV